MTDKRYRECMAEIVGVLKKYDMAGAITVVAKERAMFRYHFPTWSAITLEGTQGIRFRATREQFPDEKKRRAVVENSAHIVMQMRDVAAQTFAIMDGIGDVLRQEVGMTHTPNADFDPELDN